MAKQITKLQYKIYRERLEKMYAELPEVEKELQTAREHGDLSENAEYDAAREAMTQLRVDIDTLEDLLKSEVLEYDNSSSITVGSLIEISSPVLKDSKVCMLGDSGNFITEPVLNTNSELGKKVLNNFSGEFIVGDNVFYVKKLINPDIDKFAKTYLPEDEAIKKLFEEAGESISQEQ